MTKQELTPSATKCMRCFLRPAQENNPMGWCAHCETWRVGKLKEHNGPIRVTLNEWIHNHDSEWPKNTCGFRTLRGRVVWGGAYYPDGCAGHLVACYRTVHEGGQTFTRVVYYDRDTKIEFVPAVIAADKTGDSK